MKTSPGSPWLSSRPTCPSLATLHPSSSPLFVSWVLTLLLVVVVCVLTKKNALPRLLGPSPFWLPSNFLSGLCLPFLRRPIWLDLPASDRCCFVAVRRCDGKCYVANKHVRALFLGGNSHLEVLSVKHLLGAVARSTDQSLARWTGPVGSPVRRSSSSSSSGLASSPFVLGSFPIKLVKISTSQLLSY